MGERTGERMKRQLILENGEVFIGEGFGAEVEKSGEVIFNTGMTGYQEAISDLTNCGQMIVMTAPLIGNSGMNQDDFESIQSAIHGLIVKEYEREPSHWKETGTLESFLRAKGIPGISGIDTRKLTRMIRNEGTLRGKICSMDEKAEEVVMELKGFALPENLVELVSTKDAYHAPGNGKRVVIVDFGLKHSVLQELIARECNVIVVPYHTTAEEILQLHPDGVLLSNGPGNPESIPDAILMVKQLLGHVPIFGLSLGHQLLALACGATTSRLPFEHRGSNHPVRDLKADRVIITNQNHGYSVERGSLEKTELELTHMAINDELVEGVKHTTAKAFGVQFIPGTYEANELYDEFILMMGSQSK